MRHLSSLAAGLVALILSLVPVAALEVVAVPVEINAINLTDAIDFVPGENGRVQLSTAPGADGIIRRIEVLASRAGPTQLGHHRAAQ
jgi:hypothetical protein